MMNELENILNSENLEFNVKVMSTFIMIYEVFVDELESKMKEFHSCEYVFENEKWNYKVDPEYSKIRESDKHPENAFFKTFIDYGAFTNEEYLLFSEIRKKRNSYTHEYYNCLVKGLNDSDVKAFNDLINLYFKLDNWWINEYEIPIAGDEIPEGYDRDGVNSSQALMIGAIVNILIKGDGKKYKEILDTLKS